MLFDTIGLVSAEESTLCSDLKNKIVTLLNLNPKRLTLFVFGLSKAAEVKRPNANFTIKCQRVAEQKLINDCFLRHYLFFLCHLESL